MSNFARDQQSEEASPSATAPANLKEITLPIAVDNSNITGAYAHYYITGRVREVLKTETQSELVLDLDDESLPKLVIDTATRFWTIKLPYSTQNMKAAALSDIAAGKTVDVSIEYDLRAKNWIVRDVYLPEDRNPAP